MQDASSKIYANNATLESKISTLSTNVTNQIKKALGIGQPIIRLTDELNSDEIRLEGAEVSRDTYASLFAIYGTTYGAGNGSTTFNLPDFRNRVIWGADSFGYIEAGLPNIKGGFSLRGTEYAGDLQQGAFYQNGQGGSRGTGHEGGAVNPLMYFDASRSSSIYGNSDTVQPAAVKVRVVTKYK